MQRTALITGAYGYLGSRIRTALDELGWSTVALVRNPRPGDSAVAWSLGDELPAGVHGDVLVHCAYDMRLRGWADICAVNVDGTATLLKSARRVGVDRILVLSSMSAYDGTKQRYGRAKLAIERAALECGAIAVRPGLVYGSDAGGMGGTLRSLTRLPVTPVITGGARQFPIHEPDFVGAVVRVLTAGGWEPEVFGIAQPNPVSLAALLRDLARRDNRRVRLVPVPWQLVYLIARIVETVAPSLGIRADSVAGVTRPAPRVPTSRAFPHLLDAVTPVEALGAAR
jgi:nucleoside-diphosphate-sugar epimerase